MRKSLKRIVSLFLALVMVFTQMPATAMAAGAEAFDEPFVSGLTSLYDGNEERAKEALDILYKTGIVKPDGTLVDLDIRTDGKAADLTELALRISEGEDVGGITVNGHDATPEQILRIKEVESSLEIVHLLDQNIEITDEHVSNLETLLNSLADGSSNLGEALETGEAYLDTVSSKAGRDLLAGNSDIVVPSTLTGREALSVSGGKYTGRYVDNADSHTDYGFELANPDTAEYYTDDRYDGMGADALPVISLNINGGSASLSLSKASKLPVSVDYKVGGGGLRSGTITWAPGETGDKSINTSTTIGAYKGEAGVQVNISNAKNAVLDGGAEVLSGMAVARSGYREYQPYEDTLHTNAVSMSGVRSYSGGNNEKLSYCGVVDWYSDDLNGKSLTFTVEYADGYYTDDHDYQWLLRLRAYALAPDADVDAAVQNYSRNGTGKEEVLFAGYDFFKIGEIQYSQWDPNHHLERGVNNTFTFEFEGTNLKNFVKNNQIKIVFIIGAGFAVTTGPGIVNVKVESFDVPTEVTIADVSVPAGTYHSGEVAPVSVTFDEPVVVDKDTKLTVNGQELTPLGVGDSFLECKTVSFGYTVREVDTGSINVTDITGVKTHLHKEMIVKGNINRSIGSAEGVSLVSNVKKDSLDLAGAVWGVDDADNASGYQTATVVIPVKSDSDTNWITNEAVDIRENGLGLPMSLPTYGDVRIDYILSGAYFSYNSGLTRYPAYVVTSGTGTPIALAARYAVPLNASNLVRKDTVEMYLAQEVVTGESVYLPNWSEAGTDENGYRYFVCGTETTGAGSEFTFKIDDNYESAPVAAGCCYAYYVKDAVPFNPEKYTERTQSYEAASEGYIKLSDGTYVVLRDKDHPEHQYDVEIVLSGEAYEAISKGAAHQETVLGISYQISDRAAFTYTDRSFIYWSSSNGDVTFDLTDEDPARAEIIFGATASNPLTVSLNILNGAKQGSANFMTYALTTAQFTVITGANPFLSIPKNSRSRTTLTDTETDILFSTNILERNYAAGHTTTTFGLNLYRVDEVGDAVSEGAEAVWAGSAEGSIVHRPWQPAEVNTVSHMTIPGAALSQTGVYAAVVSAVYEGGEGGTVPEQKTLTATAYLTVKQGPARVTLNGLDSYSVMDTAIPAIGYTVSPAAAEVRYTVQKAGEEVSELRTPENTGVIPFGAGTPEGLKDVYVITVYARNKTEDPWSADAMMLTVYNHEALDLVVSDAARAAIGGTTGGTGESAKNTTVTMDNTEKVRGYLDGRTGGALSFTDFTALRTDISLQKIISANYGSGAWGAISDKMRWASEDPDLISINYEQGGIYSDLRNYAYTSYAPATDLLLVGKDDATVTVTATHAATGMTASLTAEAKTITDKLFMFQFYPKAVTSVSYKNGEGETRLLTSNADGQIAFYEPEGLAGSVMALSNVDGETYVGTMYPAELESGERDVASLQLYPCNNLRMRSISSLSLTFLKPDGSAYEGPVTLRGGVYKNNVYCPNAMIRTGTSTASAHNGREDISATVTDGRLGLWFDASQFGTPEDNDALAAGDTVTYVLEYSLADYQTGYAVIHAADTSAQKNDTESVVQLQSLRGVSGTPQITRQTLQQYHGDRPNGYTREVIDYTDNLGISKEFDKSVLTTDVSLMGESVGTDSSGYSVYAGAEDVLSFYMNTADGEKLAGQSDASETANQILDLSDLGRAQLYVFPFSSVPMLRSIYTMTADTLSQNGITSYDTITRVKAVFKRGAVTVRSETLPYGIANLSDLPDPKEDTTTIGSEIQEDIQKELDLGSAFKNVNVNDMLKKGFVFLGGMEKSSSAAAPNLMILPTENPEIFRIIALIGRKKTKNKNDDGLSVNYDPDQLYEDAAKYQKEIEESSKDDKKEDSSGEGKLDFNFYGTIMLETGWNSREGKWQIDFVGGSVGANIKGKYGWSQTFMCGPYPFMISLDLGFHTDVELAFANRDSIRAMLLDAAFGLSIEAFAGLGFDLSLVSFQLGIFGDIGADFNFLYLTKGNRTGEKLDIDGEIGIKMKIKLLFISYSQTFASTGFNWWKKWEDYDEIKRLWAQQGYAEVFGETLGGRNYAMTLYEDGTGLVVIDGGGEVESRDYLALADRVWSSGKPSGKRLLKAAGPLNHALNNVQTNAYPYANPVLTEDGGMFLYISDNNNEQSLQTTISYALKDGSGYQDMGRVEPSDTILADSDVVVSGSGSNIFSAWIRQTDSPEKEMGAKVGYDDLGMMLNATEICAGRYDGNAWMVERLTDNNNADMAPAVASSGSKAVVAWRSLNASAMPKETQGEEGNAGTSDLSSLFNVENSICYRIYNGSEWMDAQVAYNGASGTVNALDAAMLSDGTSILTYTVRTDSHDVKSTETFYTIIDQNGTVVTTARLTNDSFTDTGVKAAALGSQFILGWYSEYDSGESAGEGETVVSHDIRLARINANGSVDMNFPESIGGGASSTVNSDFRFVLPQGSDSLGDLSVVWAHRKESDAAEDNGKYQVSAVRCFESDGITGFTVPAAIVETDKNFTVDHFDAYDDGSGVYHVVVQGSDYSQVAGIEYFDSIGTGNTSQLGSENDAEDSNNTSFYSSADPISYIRLGSGSIPENEIEASVSANLYELSPGLDLPVRFSVKNTGTSVIDRVTVSGGLDKTFDDLGLLPGQSKVLVADYAVPESRIHDETFTVTPENGSEFELPVILNRPDIGISGMKVTREGDGTRDIRLTLRNNSGIPLADSGKEVKVAFYKDSLCTEQVGETVSVDESRYAEIDQGTFVMTRTVELSSFLINEEMSCARVYARAWVEGVEELYTSDNTASVKIQLLDVKYGTALTLDASFTDNQDGSYTVTVDAQNNKNTQHTDQIYVRLLDAEGHELATKAIDEAVTFEPEQKITGLNITFQSSEFDGSPASAEVFVSKRVYLVLQAPLSSEDAQRLGHEMVAMNPDIPALKEEMLYVRLDSDGKPEFLPELQAEEEYGQKFYGWFTGYDPNSERVTENTVFQGGEFIYGLVGYNENVIFTAEGATVTATWPEGQHDPESITLVQPALRQEGGSESPEVILQGRIRYVGTPTVVYRKGDTVLPEAPTTRGTYTASITVDEATAVLEYTIIGPYPTMETPPTAVERPETGEPQALAEAGSGVVGGTLKYALSASSTSMPQNGWSEEIPTGTAYGTYYVWYRVFPDESHAEDPNLRGVLTSKISLSLASGYYVGRSFDGSTVTQARHDLPEGYQVITETHKPALRDGWYIVIGDNVAYDGFETTGDVNLVLADGAALTVNGGIQAAGAFNVYAQTEGTGRLTINGGRKKAFNGTILNIHGGEVSASVTGDTAGICADTLTIYDGTVNASAKTGAGIGGDKSQGYNGTVNIYGGHVTARSTGTADTEAGMGIGAGSGAAGNGTLNLGPGVGMKDDEGYALASPSENVQTCEIRRPWMITGEGKIKPAISYREGSFDASSQEVEYEEKTVAAFDYTELTSAMTVWKSGWYVLKENVTISDRITVSGDVKLILSDDVVLEALKGIQLTAGNTLRIYGQAKGTGKLTATYVTEHVVIPVTYAAIGDESKANSGGAFYLHGGEISASADTANEDAAINAGTVVVYGGKLTATSVSGAGIGSGARHGYGGTVTIYGGSVVASSTSPRMATGMGIGAGDGSKEHGGLTLGPGVGFKDINGYSLIEPDDSLWEVPEDTPRASYMETGEGIPKVYLGPVFYVDENGNELMQEKYAVVYAGMNQWHDPNGWYVVSGSVTIPERIMVSGDVVNLILLDGAELVAEKGIQISQEVNNFIIYGQSKGTGRLTASSDTEGTAAIRGSFNVSGGQIEATGGAAAPAIKGNRIDFLAGTINAAGGENAPAIEAAVSLTVFENATVIAESGGADVNAISYDFLGLRNVTLYCGSEPHPETTGTIATEAQIENKTISGRYMTIQLKNGGGDPGGDPGGDEPPTELPNFVQVTGNLRDALDNMSPCTEDQARAWIAAHAEELDAKTKVKFVIFDRTEEPDDVQYRFFIFMQSSGLDEISDSADGLINNLNPDDALVYVPTAGGGDPGGDEPPAQLPNFVRVTENLNDALENMIPCTEEQALAWIAANADMLNSEGRAKYVIFARMEDIGEPQYLGFEFSSTEYLNSAQSFSDDHLDTMMHFGEWIYVPTAGGSINFIQITENLNAALESMPQCTEGQARAWIAAHAEELDNAPATKFVIFARMEAYGEPCYLGFDFVSAEYLAPSPREFYVYELEDRMNIGKYVAVAVRGQAPTFHTITWKNEDGTLIDTTQAAYGTVPTHNDPTKASDAQYSYTFTGWTDSTNTFYAKNTALPAVTGDMTYTATYTRHLKISQGQYIRMGTYNGKPVDWYCQRINNTWTFMLCKYALKESKFGSNATYKTSNVHAWLDVDSGGTFASDLDLTDTELSLVRTVDLSGSAGDGTDSFIIPAYGNNELNKGQKVHAPYRIDTGALVPIYWLRTARDSSNARVVNHSKDGSPVATVAARYSGVGNNQWIRPMFYLDTNVIKNLPHTGTGTEDDPYVFTFEGETVASVTSGDGTTTDYTSLEDAVSHWTDGTTLKLYKNGTYTAVIGVPVGTSKTLDLNGRMLTTGKTMSVKGTLTIMSSTPGARITPSANITVIDVYAGATLNISGGTIIGCNENKPVLNGSGTFNLNGGKITTPASKAFSLNNEAKLNLNAGEIVCTSSSTDMGISSAILADGSTTINWIGTSIRTNAGDGIRMKKDGTGTVNVSGGSFTATSANPPADGAYALYNNFKMGTLYLKGNPELNGRGVYLEDGKVININGKLSNTTPISVTMQTSGVFTSGLKGNGDISNFSNGTGDDCVLELNASGEAQILRKYTVTWMNGDTVLETDTGVLQGAAPEYNGAAPVKDADEQYIYTFSGWSDGETTYAPADLPEASGDATYTAVFTAVKIFDGYSISLNGDIGVNFYINLPDSAIADGAAVEFVWTVEGQEKTHSVTLTDNDKTSTGYKASCPIAIAEMTYPITAKLTVGEKSYTDTYSAAQYANVILTAENFAANYVAAENAKGNNGEVRLEQLRTLVKTMLDYGSKAQIRFGRNTENLANGGKDYDSSEVTMMSNADNMSEYLSECGLQYVGTSVVYLSETTLRHYYKIVQPDLFTEEIQNSVTFDGREVTYGTRGDMIYFDRENISAPNLDTPYVISINGHAYRYSALDYSALSYNADEKPYSESIAKQLAASVYRYNTAANTYFNS